MSKCLRAPAAALVGGGPGRRAFLVGVAREGALPERLRVPGGATPATALAAASGGRVSLHELEIEP